MKNVGYKRVSEFIEDDFISAVELVISRAAYPTGHIEISRVSQDEEHYVGYDGVLTSLIPFYLQFKRSTFHTPQFKGKTMRDREACGFATKSGFFSFTLHKNRNSKDYDQHNILHRLSKRFSAAYVAPLFYKKSALSKYKTLTPVYAWTYKDMDVFIAETPHTPIEMRNVRILHQTMTITPHEPITDHLPSHEYTYSHNGDICFHSKVIPLDASRRTLYDLIEKILGNLDQMKITPEEQSKKVVELLAEVFSSDWRSRSFQSMLKSYLVELDILPATWNGDIHRLLLEEIGSIERLLLAETVLWSELRIAQYVARVRRA